MKYYSDGRYVELVLHKFDKSVKQVVEYMYEMHPNVSDMKLSTLVQEHYYYVVGFYNDRLENVINYYCEIVTGEREILFDEDIDSMKFDEMSHAHS